MMSNNTGAILNLNMRFHNGTGNIEPVDQRSNQAQSCDSTTKITARKNTAGVNGAANVDRHQVEAPPVPSSPVVWFPAMDFLKAEETAALHSFTLPDFEADIAVTDGFAYQKLVHRLSALLNAHTVQANILLAKVGTHLHQLPESVEETLRVAVGRSQLLLNKRLKQFQQQLERHLNPIEGEKLTKLDDLHGLWALVDMQLADLRSLFDRIEKSRLNGWAEEETNGHA